MGTMVNTVMGPISPEDLGVTLIHEHLVYGFPGWQCDTAAPPYDREGIAAECIKVVREAQKYGLKTLVDVTPIDGSRDPDLYKMVAGQTGINLVCSTGLFNEVEGSPNYFRLRALLTGNPRQVVSDMCESFVRDITVGIGDSGVKAGVIKVATSKDNITPYEKMVLEAAAMAHRETGAPIVTHTEEGTMGPQQADFLMEKGVDPKRLLIGHMCNDSLPYHQEVLQRGAYLGFDRFGLDYYFPDTKRLKILLALLESGHEGQIMISNDFVVHWPGRKIIFPEPLRPFMAKWKLTHVFENILPALKSAGVDDGRINTIMVDNPRRLLAGS